VQSIADGTNLEWPPLALHLIRDVYSAGDGS